MTSTSSTSSRIRQAGPLLLLVVGIPLATIVAGVSTLVISLRTGSTDAVIDPVTRTAQVQDRELAADQRAQMLRLHGQGQYVADTGAIALEIEGATVADGVLRLAILHPVRSSEDSVVTLTPAGDGRWLGRIEIDAGHDWNLQLTSTEGNWRLVGRMVANEPQFVLQPALRP